MSSHSRDPNCKTGDDESSTHPIKLTEDTKIKTDAKTLLGIGSCIIIGTVAAASMYGSVTSKIEGLGSKIDSSIDVQKASNEAMKQRIDYLYYMTNTFNPFEGNSFHAPIPTAPATNPGIQPRPIAP